MPPVPGFLLTLEGPEGGGKSTQAQRLAVALQDAGYAVCATREPGGTSVGETIRRLLLGRDGTALSAWSEALLFTAARAQLIEDVIVPALAAGQVVVCDRFSDSTLAYQGHGRGLDLDLLRGVQAAATHGLKPALTFLLDLPVEEGLHRIPRTSLDRLDREVEAFHDRVRRGYHALAAEEPARWVVVDAQQPTEQLAHAIFETSLERIQRAGVHPAMRHSA